MLSTPRPRGRGKRRPDRGGGAAKRPRMESSSSDRRDGSEESRSGGTRDRPGRGSRRAAGPSTPPHRPPPVSVSPRRSPRLTKSAVRDLRSLPLTTKSDRRTAHSRSVSGDEHGRGPSRSSRSSSDHGRSSQGRRSRSREPTPPQLMNFNIDDFAVVSHTTDSFTYTSAHPFFPGWVRVVSAHREERVRNVPCNHNQEEEQRVRRRVRRDVEPPEVRRFLRQELLKKVGHSWWNWPRVYCHDRDDEREPTPSLRSVVVVPSGQEQPEESPDQQDLGPIVSGDRMTLVRPVASPVTSLPHTPGRDIVIAGNTEESPRTREGRLAAVVWRRPYDLSGSGQSPRHHLLKELSHREWWPRPATPSLGRGTQPPHPCGPRVAGFRQRASQQGRERPESWQNLPSRSGERRVPEGNRAEAGASRVQPKPSCRTGAATAHAHPCSRD